MFPRGEIASSFSLFNVIYFITNDLWVIYSLTNLHLTFNWFNCQWRWDYIWASHPLDNGSQKPWNVFVQNIICPTTCKYCDICQHIIWENEVWIEFQLTSSDPIHGQGCNKLLILFQIIPIIDRPKPKTKITGIIFLLADAHLVKTINC